MEINVRKSKNGAVYSDVIVTPWGRLSYPHLFKKGTPYKGKGEGKYEGTLYIPKTSDITALIETGEKVGRLAFGAAWKGLDSLTYPIIKDGDEQKDDNCQSCWVIRAKSANKPGVVDGQKKNLTEEDVYGGCWARFSLVIGSYGDEKDQGLSFYLNNVQKFKDDERFGGGKRSAQDDFETFEQEAQADF